MIRLYYLFRLAVLNLLRGGQRVLVALLCIAFGVMSLVAMTMMAQSIASAVVLAPDQVVGGDISMGRKNEDTLRPADFEQLKALQQSGEISSYTLIAFNNSIMFHKKGSGEMNFAGNGMGVELDMYPLVGSLALKEPGSTGLSTLLQQVGDVVPTRDLAETYGLKVGDAIVLADLRTGNPVEGTVRGIANDTPNHYGDKIYYSLATAQKLANTQAVVNTVILKTVQPEALSQKLENSGWQVDWSASRRDAHTANLWLIGLRGAGILGLLVGGIGIANTMQVLLRRRQKEIAVWKTLGYQAGDLRVIFTLEAALLGLTGSLLGAGVGIGISSGLLELFRRTSTMLYQWTFSPTPPTTGVLVGTLTTILFAAWAIVRASQVRPMGLLRNEPVDISQFSGCQSVVLALALVGMFTVLTSFVMGSAVSGIGVLLALGAGIGMLGGVFSAVLWACTRILPLGRFPVVRMAITSLRRRGTALVFAMIALFMGILSMSLGMEVAQFRAIKLSGGMAITQSYNLTILDGFDQEDAVLKAVSAQHPQKVGLGYRAALAGIHGVDGEQIPGMDAVLVGRSDPADYIISGAAWGSQPDSVYGPRSANLEQGHQVQITFPDGTTRTMHVAGWYTPDYRANTLYPPGGLLMTAEAFKQIAKPDSISVFVQVSPGDLDRAANSLGAALPQASVINLDAYAARFMNAYRNLFVLPMVTAGLALLAGILLVTNTTSLAMLDRRYEIGILKTVGYARRQVLSIFVVEYGLVGLLATTIGLLLIVGMIVIVSIANHMSLSILLLTLPPLAPVALCGTLLPLLAAVGVSWKPASVLPVTVLSEQN